MPPILDIGCLALLLAPAGWLLSYFQSEEALVEVAWAAVCAVCAATLAGLLMPVLANYTLKSGLRGKDLGKRYTPSAQQDMCVVSHWPGSIQQRKRHLAIRYSSRYMSGIGL